MNGKYSNALHLAILIVNYFIYLFIYLFICDIGDSEHQNMRTDFTVTDSDTVKSKLC